MFNIKDFLGKFQSLRNREVLFRSSIQQSIKKVTGIDISAESISISSSTLTLKGVSQSIRSVIFIKKQALIQEINSAQQIYVITDIR